jgi:hypothetical protein
MGMASQTRSATQSVTQSFTPGHIMRVIRVFDEGGNVIETHEHKGDFKEPVSFLLASRRGSSMISLAALTRRDRISQINPSLFVLCAVRRACICTW